MATKPTKLGEVLFEFIPQGAYIKVCAVDPVTRIEVSIVGDPRAGKQRLEQIALNKLRYVLRKKQEEKGAASHRQNLI